MTLLLRAFTRPCIDVYVFLLCCMINPNINYNKTYFTLLILLLSLLHNLLTCLVFIHGDAHSLLIRFCLNIQKLFPL